MFGLKWNEMKGEKNTSSQLVHSRKKFEKDLSKNDNRNGERRLEANFYFLSVGLWVL